jgi:hypothetical protein
MNADVTTATMAEALETPSREATVRRLRDWQQRVHGLYHEVQAALGPEYAYDRDGKQRSAEDRVQSAGLSEDDVPPVDILRVEKGGHVVAQFLPRMFWMIGANGRIDLFVTPSTGGRRFFMLIDRSLPLSNRSDWRLVRPTMDPLAQPTFHPERLHELLE